MTRMVSCQRTIQLCQKASTAASASATTPVTGISKSSSGKQLPEMPGPKVVPLFGSLLWYRFGPFGPTRFQQALEARYKQYGPIVKERMGMRTVVRVFDPDDSKVLHQTEGRMPHIVPMQETTQMYRSMRDLSLGLGNMNGEDWYRLRQAVQQMMMRPKEVQHFLPLTVAVARDFVAYVAANRTTWDEVVDFRNRVAQWALEAAGNIVFERRLRCIGASKNEWAQRMVDANAEIFRLTGQLKFRLPLYKYVPTPKWRRLVRAEDYFYGEAKKLIDQTVANVQTAIESGRLKEDQYTFMAYLLGRSDLDAKDVAIIAISLFGDGLNTTAPAVLYNLYCLAKNPTAQARLHEEVTKNLPPATQTDAPIGPEVIARMPYLKACVKESFRLFPVGAEISRVPQEDLVLSGYHVPAQTEVNITMNVHLRNEKYFPRPHEYLPERWLRGSALEAEKTVHPYIAQPFGHGPRMCAGRRFAEQDLYVLLSLLVQRFKIFHHYGSLSQEYHTLLLPSGSTQFAFVDR